MLGSNVMSYMGWGKLTDDGFGERFLLFLFGGCGAGKKVHKATRLFLGTCTIINNHYKTSLIESNSSRRQENEREREIDIATINQSFIQYKQT